MGHVFYILISKWLRGFSGFIVTILFYRYASIRKHIQESPKKYWNNPRIYLSLMNIFKTYIVILFLNYIAWSVLYSFLNYFIPLLYLSICYALVELFLLISHDLLNFPFYVFPRTNIEQINNFVCILLLRNRWY